MNAHDRRIIHLALKNNKSVRTQSVGDGYYRKLIVLPKRRKRMPKTKSRSRQS
jgi:spoIIIJ-associated protein